MGNTKAEVSNFLKRCDQLRASKFIMATTRIRDILKGIAGSRALYELFSEITAGFDYVAAKRKYFVGRGDRFYGRSRLILPEDAAERLAFTFCLLVEFDHGDMNFNEFLQRYFPVDGSYFSSFHDFCDKVILSMEEIIREVFAAELAEEQPQAPAAAEAQVGTAQPAQPVQPEPAAQDSAAGTVSAEKISAVSILINGEKNYIASSDMGKAAKEDGFAMLNALLSAVRAGNAEAADAILRGYEYYSACHKNFSKLFERLSAAMGE